MKLDKDLKEKTVGELRRELQKARNAIRKHKKAEGNSRCWHNDLELYEKTLPEKGPAGRMDLPEGVLLRNCKRYIRRQQCSGIGCLKSPSTICPTK